MSRKAKNTVAREELEKRIGYTFADKSILDRALTHISAASPKLGRGGSYQRLEFLGDHVLGLAVSDMLYRAFPKGDEGELSRRLADLVRRESCADVARTIDLGAALRLGGSESNAGGRRRTATLADVCEALIGAVFVDGGYPAAAAFIERLPNGYGQAVAERGATLSVGQKQLLSFARALAFDPEILILDEATSSVDTETELTIRDALKVLMAGRTTLAIAHRLSTIQDMDKILVLHKGELRESGTHQELLAGRGIYYKLYQLQFKDQELTSR